MKLLSLVILKTEKEKNTKLSTRGEFKKFMKTLGTITNTTHYCRMFQAKLEEIFATTVSTFI